MAGSADASGASSLQQDQISTKSYLISTLQEKLRESPLLLVALATCGATFLLELKFSAASWGVGLGVLVATFVARAARSGWNDALRRGELPSLVLVLAMAPILYKSKLAEEAWMWVVLLAVLLMSAIAPLLAQQFASGRLRIANLPGLVIRRPHERTTKILTGALAVLSVLFVATAIGVVPPRLLATAAGTVILWGTWTCFLLVRFRLESQRGEALVRESLSEYQPGFALHWSAPRNTSYQISMWLPYLKRIGVPFFIVVRTRASFDDAVRAAGDIPVVLAESARALERVVVPSLRAVFYVNNSDRNSHLVRFAKLTHIQLLHGDSEKAPSYNPVTAIFDRVYVAGQAAIDRYPANGVDIPQEKFAIVGRPQVEGVARAEGKMSDLESKTVLYAPTWAGLYDDSSYSSLLVVQPVLERLLSDGCRIIFRAHPYSDRSPDLRAACEAIRRRLRQHSRETGIAHVVGAKAEVEMTLTECFNGCDAMIADVSSVVSDFLFSGKPLALMTGDASPEQLLAELPLAQAAYIISMDDAAWPEQVDNLLTSDPLRTVREHMRDHYLGNIPAEGYAEVFVRTARHDVLGDTVPRETQSELARKAR